MTDSDSGKKKTIMVAGGGTGGHIWAGVAIAEAWQNKYTRSDSNAVFVGTRGRMEEKLVPKTDLKLELLSLGPLKAVSFLTRLMTFVKLPFALLKSAQLILRYRPKVIVGVGGFSSGPVVLMGWFLKPLLGVRLGVLEQNSVPGFTNRVLSRFADIVFLNFTGTSDYFSKNRKEIVGNPVRARLVDVSQGAGPTEDSQRLSILAFGGSQGAVGLNSTLLEALKLIGDRRENVYIVHQTGERDFDRVQRAYRSFQFKNVEVLPFIDDMKSAYQSSDIVISRAGASTLSELAAVGKAAILIPFPGASDQHQLKNAREYEHSGAARVVEESEAGPSKLAEMIVEFQDQPEKIQRLSQEIRKLFRPSAAADVIKHLLTENDRT